MSKVFNREIKLVGRLTKINGVSIRVMEYDNDGKVLRASGLTVPTGAGYAKGALFIKTDAATGVKGLYENVGTTSSASFNQMGVIGDAEIVFSDGGAIDDNNGNEVLQFGVVASAINQVKVKNAAIGNAPEVMAVGDDTNIDLQLTPKGTGSVKVPAANGVKSSVANLVAPFMPNGVQQALSGAGAVDITSFYTAVTNTGADALTLADSTVVGQLKKVKMIVDPGTDSTLTFNTNATIVFADVGDYAILMWNGSDWIPVELGNDADGATAPVYTPAS